MTSTGATLAADIAPGLWHPVRPRDPFLEAHHRGNQRQRQTLNDHSVSMDEGPQSSQEPTVVTRPLVIECR